MNNENKIQTLKKEIALIREMLSSYKVPTSQSWELMDIAINKAQEIIALGGTL